MKGGGQAILLALLALAVIQAVAAALYVALAIALIWGAVYHTKEVLALVALGGLFFLLDQAPNVCLGLAAIAVAANLVRWLIRSSD